MKSHKLLKLSLLLLSTNVFASGPTATFGKTEVTVGGYVKLDTMVTKYNKGTDPTVGAIGQDGVLIAIIPAAQPAGFKSNPDFHMQAKESAISVASKTQLSDSTKLSTYFEMDFKYSAQGEEVLANGYSPRVKQAYMELNEWLAGQTYTTFLDYGAYPEILDFGGPAGLTFVRQPQIRWTKKLNETTTLQVAVENPTTNYIAPNAIFPTISSQDRYPDFVIKATYNEGSLHLGAAALVRQLNLHNNVLWESLNRWTFSGSVFGKINPFTDSKDNIRFLVNYGSGLGRYTGNTLFPDAYVAPDNTLHTPSTLTGYLALQHFWCSKIRSSFVYSYISTDLDSTKVNPGVNKEGRSIHANLIWSPYAPVDIGVEYIWAKRVLENNISGNISRGQLSIKYNFA